MTQSPTDLDLSGIDNADLRSRWNETVSISLPRSQTAYTVEAIKYALQHTPNMPATVFSILENMLTILMEKV